MQILLLFRYVNDFTEHRHQELIKKKFALSTKARDKYFYFENGDLGIVESITDLNMTAYVIKKKISSKLFGKAIEVQYSIYKMNTSTRRTAFMQLALNCVQRKDFCLPSDDNPWIIFPLLRRV